jgi:hypothetical protein
MQNPQAQLLLLRYTIVSSYMFSTRTTPPDATDQPLRKLNKLVQGAIDNITGVNNSPAYVHSIAALSLANGGLGITDLHAIRHTAYFSSVTHAIQTWSKHFGPDNPIISGWLDSSTRSGIQLDESFKIQTAMLATFNTTTIKPAPLHGSDALDKADPEQHVKIPQIPKMPQSTKQIPKFGGAAASKLQNTLSKVANVVAFRTAWNAIPTTDRKRRCQFLANSVNSSNLWLRAIPTTAKFRMSPLDFRTSLLIHFALDHHITALIQLPTLNNAIPCACGGKDKFGVPLKATYEHLVNCIHAKVANTRHNNMSNVAAEAVRSVGLVALMECPASKIVVSSTGNTEASIQQNKRFDVTVAGIPDCNVIQTDITVASHRQREESISKQCSRFALSAANNAVTAKHNTYDAVVGEDETFLPLAAETSGALHNGWNKFYTLLASRVDNRAPLDANWTTPSFTSYWMTITSITLRRENARALQKLAREARTLAGHVTEDLPDMVSGGHRRRL